MHTMLVINFNACVFANCGFSFLFHIGEHTKKHEIALHGLLHNKPCLCKRWVSFGSNEKITFKGFCQKKFTLVYCWFIFKYDVGLLFLFF